MEQLIKHGLIHCHTENSLKDSTLSPTELAKRARAYGAPAVSITDHGTLTGIFEFVKAVEAVNGNKDDPWFGVYNLKAIVGVEGYLQENDDLRRSHFLLLAKNYTGYLAIAKAVTKSNTRIIDDIPCFDMEIINEFFAPGTIGHGNVIATSACVGGVLAQVLLKNATLQKEIDRLTRKAEKYSNPNDPSFKKNQKLLEAHHQRVEELVAKRDELKKIAEMKFGKWERAISKMTGETKTQAEVELSEKKKKTEDAKIQLAQVKSDLAIAKRRETATRQAITEARKSHEKWSEMQSEITLISTGLAADEDLYRDARDLASRFAKIFGSNNFFIELQYHGIPEEAIVMPKLAKMATELGLPVVACNDVHFAANDPQLVRARALVNALRRNKWFPQRDDDSEYYIKTDDELRVWLEKILDVQTVNRAFDGIRDIVEACNVVFPKDTHYPKFVGGIAGETAKGRLRRLTEEGIATKYPDGSFAYRDRVEYELKVIEDMQYTDYLCIVQDYLNHGRQLGLQCPEGVGYAIGPGRGSAAGSLVCYLIGITSIDPMPLGLLFERFLNPDRVTSPDIDADLSMEVRGKVLDYVKAKYGDDAVCCITTKDTLAAKAAIKAVARVRGSEKFGDAKDATTIFYDLGNAIAKLIPNEPGIKLSSCVENLRAAFPDNEDAQEIISDAMLIEGTSVGYGMHAAGVIIADNGNVREYIPLRWNADKEQWCSQCDKEEAEGCAGLLKFDFLGLRNLDIISFTLRLIKRNTGLAIDIEKVPQESAIYKEIFARGKTGFIFQFESDGMKNLLRKFKPEKLEHLILLNALFRPGPLQYADPICETKAGKKKSYYICDKAKAILSVTYGYPVYQEQIMQLCNLIAGFSLGEADQVRRYMSKKKADKLALFKPKFIEGLLKSGISDDYLKEFCSQKNISTLTPAEKAEAQKLAAEDYWDQLMHFAEYGFNKSHAAVYAVVAYYTAWLKFHYPTEYMTAVLNYTPIERLPQMIEECKSLGVKVLAPDINKSFAGFTGKNGEILFGLSNIKNVGNGAADILSEREEHGTYKSLKDLIVRANPSKKVCEALIDAGAFDCWCTNRAAMKIALPDLQDDSKKVRDKEELIISLVNQLNEAPDLDEKDRAKLQKKLENTISKRDEYQERFDCSTLPVNMPENKSERLAAENDLLGMYISGHPLEEYPDAMKKRTSSIIDAKNRTIVTVCGVIRKLHIKKRKSDGKPMAFFSLEDETGAAEGCCFTRAYESIGQLLEDNIVVLAEGKFSIEENSETNEIRRKISVENVIVVKPKPKKLLVIVKGLPLWTDVVYPQLIPFETDCGANVVVYDTILGEFRTTTLHLAPDVLQEYIEGAEICEKDI